MIVYRRLYKTPTRLYDVGLSYKLDLFAFMTLLLLSMQGALNYLFSGTVLNVWKQTLISIMFFLVMGRLKSREAYTAFFVGIASASVLAVTSIVQGLDGASILYNLFYFISWIPFYFFGRTANIAYISKYMLVMSFLAIIVSGIGLMIQLNTSYLDFLNNQLEATEFQTINNEAKRLNFVFVASTLVMPTLVGLFRLICMRTYSSVIRIACVFFLILSAIPTGSVGGFVMLAGALFIASVRMTLVANFIGIVAIVLALGFFLSDADEVINTQLSRVLTNDSKSESNVGRIALWEYAMNIIGNFSFDEHIVGVGLGSTNESQLASSRFMHGESSFFQAYIEGGVIGFILRLTPFVLLLSATRARGYLENLSYGLSLLICCAAAPLFGCYGIQCMLGYIAGISRQQKVRT